MAWDKNGMEIKLIDVNQVVLVPESCKGIVDDLDARYRRGLISAREYNRKILVLGNF